MNYEKLLESFGEWRPTTYATFSGILQIDDRQSVEYEGTERDWWIIDKTPEENKALGHVFEVKETTFDLVAWGASWNEALDRLKNTVQAHLNRMRA